MNVVGAVMPVQVIKSKLNLVKGLFHLLHHIFAKITNDSNEGKVIEVKAGDGFMQAIFIPYGITYSDSADGVRNGGMGSTGK